MNWDFGRFFNKAVDAGVGSMPVLGAAYTAGKAVRLFGDENVIDNALAGWSPQYDALRDVDRAAQGLESWSAAGAKAAGVGIGGTVGLLGAPYLKRDPVSFAMDGARLGRTISQQIAPAQYGKMNPQATGAQAAQTETKGVPMGSTWRSPETAAAAAAAPNEAKATAESTQQSEFMAALRERLGMADQRAGELAKKVEGLQNPYDVNGQGFQTALARGTDDVNRSFAGANTRLMTNLGARNQAGGIGATVAQANLARQQAQARSDLKSGMYADAIGKGADFEMRRVNALDALNNQDFARGSNIFGSLLNVASGDKRFNEQMGYQRDRAVIDDGFRQQAIDIAKQANLDAKETALWSNITNSLFKFGPGVADFIMKKVQSGELDIRAVMKMLDGADFDLFEIEGA